MMSDILAVAWKEWREFLLQRGSRRATLLNLLLMAFVFGVFLPLQSGRAWVESPVSLAAWVWLPLFLVTSMIADSFAGERERHTLETLLASRLSDSAILFGKMASAISYALSLTVFLLAVSLATVNLSAWNGRFLLYPASTVVGALVVGLLGACLVAGLGVLFSLRAASVRQAAQTLSIGIMLLIWIPIMLVQVVPADLLERWLGRLLTWDVRILAALVVLALLTLDIIVVAAAMTRFRRARLILD